LVGASDGELFVPLIVHALCHRTIATISKADHSCLLLSPMFRLLQRLLLLAPSHQLPSSLSCSASSQVRTALHHVYVKHCASAHSAQADEGSLVFSCMLNQFHTLLCSASSQVGH
jgi:hypothetical protein